MSLNHNPIHRNEDFTGLNFILTKHLLILYFQNNKSTSLQGK